MTYLLFDLAIAAILLLFFLSGERRGLILSLFSTAAVLVALVGAAVLSEVLAEPAAKAIEPVIASGIHDTVTSYYERSFAENTSPEEDWLAQLPVDELLEPLLESKFFQGYAEDFKKAVGEGVTDIVTHAAQELAHYVAVQLARTVLFLICFVVVLAAWYLIGHALDIAAHLPVLYTANRGLGGLFGVVKGALLLFLAAWVCRQTGALIPPEAPENTILLRFFWNTNPLELISGI